MANKTKGKPSRAPLFVAVCGLALVGGLGYYVMTSPGRSIPPPSDPVTKKSQPEVKVYTPSYDKGELKLDQKSGTPSEKEDPRVYAVNAYLAQLKMVPAAARAKTCRIDGAVATLDFSNEFETTYGTEDEQTIVKGLLTTMGQFADIKEVKFTVGGRTLESLGNIDLTVPQAVLRAQDSSGR